MQHKLRMSEDQVVERAVSAVKMGARIYRRCGIFGRRCGAFDIGFLVRVFDAVIQAVPRL